MTDRAAQRSGVSSFGDTDTLVGNFLSYPARVIVEVLKLLFAQPGLISTDATQDDAQRNPFLYKTNEDGSLHPQSRLVIVKSGALAAERPEGRPRIEVSRASGGFQSGRLAQRHGWDPSGERTFRDIFESSLIIRCIGRHSDESEMLAVAVQNSLVMFREPILKHSRLSAIGNPSAGPAVLLEADATSVRYETTVSMSIHQTVGWTTRPIDPEVMNHMVCVIQEVRF